MRNFTWLVILFPLSAFPAEPFFSDANRVVYAASGAFGDFRDDIADAILERGMVISNISKVGEMLERTGHDLGGAELVYGNAEDAVELRDPQAFFDESFLDLHEELGIAREEGKLGVLIMFEIDDCPFCARMRKTVLNRGDVQDYFHAHFRILSINAEVQSEMTDFSGQPTTQKEFSLKEHRIRATPVFMFFDLEGRPIKRGRLIGATKDAGEFLLLGRFIVEGHNEKTTFSRFKRTQEAAGSGDSLG